jgi:hypothetical protein
VAQFGRGNGLSATALNADNKTAKEVGRYEPILGLLRSGEGSFNSVNRGRAGDTPGGRADLTKMTIGQVMALQKAGIISAAGAYQFIQGTLAFAMQRAGLQGNAPFSPFNQHRLAIALLTNGQGPALAAYLLGKTNDIRAALTDISREWASLQGPGGRGAYDGRNDNRASIPTHRVAAALLSVRNGLAAKGNNG